MYHSLVLSYLSPSLPSVSFVQSLFNKLCSLCVTVFPTLPVLIFYAIYFMLSFSSISFTTAVSLYTYFIRHPTLEHPIHRKVNPSSLVSAHCFVQPDNAKSTQLWQSLLTKCHFVLTCSLHGAISDFIYIFYIY